MRDVIAIETKRLNLRPIAMSDARRIARFCDDPGVGRMLAQTIRMLRAPPVWKPCRPSGSPACRTRIG